ncbi:MAG: phosphopantetheine-binding protein [Methylohalobius sp. ZOD2]
MDSLEIELKQLIIQTFDLEGLAPTDIDSGAPLFGAGLGLDSIDALELGLALKQRYGISITHQTPQIREIFASVSDLAGFIRRSRPSE